MLDATTPSLPLLADLPPLHKAAFGFLAEHTTRTREAYEGHLKRYFKWCEDHGLDPMKIERTHVALYVRYLSEERGNRGTTINSAFTAIRGFYKWAFLEDLIDRDPVVHVRLPKAQYRKKYPLEREELRAIRYAGYEIGGRHWALTEMLVIHGMRISECCDVLIENFQRVEGGHRVLTFRRKGGREETVPLPPQMVAAFEECAGERTSGHLLHALDYSPGPLHRSSATGLLNTVVRHSGVKKHVNPHLIRASSITVGFEGWFDVREAQWFAGHEDPRTTSRHYDLGRRNHDRHPVHIQNARLSAAWTPTRVDRSDRPAA